ncbi:MAG: chitobiase/beta-hexosaminidase C-terminal domain-containing protein [Bacteroidales bacterium]|nr:chitobiase/beta-hexosaminidase C-terminal domain-containing protein [Bacteroidales bacterium]
MKNLFVIKRFYLLMLFVVIGFSQMYGWGDSDVYYAKATAKVNPTGAGTVYVESNAEKGATGEESTGIGTTETSGGNVSFTFVATPKGIHDFKGWSEINDVNTSSFVTTNNPYTRNYTASNEANDEGAATTNTLYAIFAEKPLFYFSATAEVRPTEFGTASSNPTKVEARSEKWNSTSATTNAITFTAEPKSDDYDFQGWSRTENGDIVSTENPYKPTLTSNSTSSNSPTGTTLYARFAEKPIFAFSATAVVTPAGAGTATVDPATTSVRGDKWNSTSATTNEFVFSATPASNYTFLGWSRTADGEIESTASPYNPTLTSNNPAASLNTTLYARFQIYPTGITATPASIVLGVNRSSNPISVSLVPQGSYKNIVFETSNSAIATVDANGVVTAKSTAGTATITIKAFKSDGVTVLATASVAVSVLEYCATPVITIAPSSDGKTATVTLSSTTPGATIYYTTDRNDPTASSMPYSSAFSISNGQTVKAIAVKDGYLNSAIATDMYSAEKVATPTIDITTSGVSFSCETPGVSFYYTINGDNPTTSLTPWNGAPLTGLSEGTNIKVIAAKSGMIISDVATKLYYPASGVSGSVVTLNDYEDHNWTYYSGVADSVDGGNYNDNYVGKLYSPNPRNVKITYNANGGAVSIDESETSFVYFKTLEQGATAGQYPYTVISNPFSKRPTGKGFGGWKIISGGQYINGYDNGSTLPLDQEISFVNLPYPSVNCISAEIVLEATWVDAKVTYLATVNNNNNNYTFNITNGSSTTTYENNFLVINRDYSGTLTLSQPVTIMMVEPNAIGTDPDYRDNYTFTGNITPNNAGVTKIEFAKWNPNGNINARGRNVTLGRGLTMEGTRRALYGTNTSNSAVNQILKVESGNFSTFTHYGANPSDITKQWIYLGNDYDRANGKNDKLTFSGLFMVGASRDLGLSSTEEMCRVFSISGSFMTGILISTGAADYSYYLGIKNNHNNGHRYFEVQGGEWYANIAGGMGRDQDNASRAFTFRMKGGIIRGSIYGAGAYAPAGGERRYIITGGNIGGWVAAGCNGIGGNTTETTNGATNGDSYVYVGGNAKIGYQNRTINDVEGGNVFGAGRGAPVTNYNVGTINNSNVVVADKAEVEKNVYGGGNYGFSLGEANIYITGGSVDGRVFGGANMTKGYSPTIIMTGGHVKDGAYGGCNTEGTINNNVTMQINGGQVGTSSAPANIHGGGYGEDTEVSGNVDITLGADGQTTGGVTVYGDVYGGSALGYVNGTTANDNYHTYVTLNEGTINGSLYGGGLGSNTVAANVYGPVKVTVNGGSVKTTDGTGENGSGGVYGANNIYGAPQSSVTVDIYGTDPAPAEGQYALHSVYGGGNKAPYNGTPIVTVHKCDNSIEYVYGGGNAASVNSTNVTIWGGNKIGNVFGGGNGTVSAANVNGDATTKIYGGTILNVFGGSNSQGTIGGTINVTVNSQAENGGDTPCTMNIGDVYGGGNRAASNVGNLNIVCTGTDGYINRVFGGANAAKITGNIELAINGGNIGSVFGGNNSEKSIEGNVTVNIGTAPNACGTFEIGNVHGGGYGKATGVTGNVEVNIAGGTINGDVYGGSALGKVNTSTSNTTAVNLTGGIIHGDAYGGGLGDSETAADVNGNVTVTLNGTAFTLATTTDDKGNSIPTSGRIFGCNNINGSPKGTVLVKVLQTVARDGEGNVKAKPDKNSGVYELQAVYGGGNLAAYNPTNPTANGQFTSYTWGVNAIPHDNLYKPLQVVIDGCDLSSIEYVYGGGNAAATPATDVTILGGYEIGSVFGGGNGKDRYTLDGGTTWNANNGADVGIIDAAAYATDKSQGKYGTGDAMTSVLGGTVHNIYGGSNTLGNIVGSATAYMDAASDCPLDAGDIYGGGNEAYMDGNSGIQLGCIEYLKEIYGGARNADVGGDINLTITSGHFDRVFGGNNLGGTIKGSITVNIEETGCNPITIGELYGCGNKAPYTTPGDKHPTINIRSFTSIGNVYGGGLGKEAVVTGNPTVNINVATGAKNAVEDWPYNGKTIDFGGGITVTLPVHEKGKIGAIGNVFGGGNAAAVIGNTQVNIGTEASKSADIRGNVYGGGNQAKVTGQTNVVIGG